MPFAVPPEAWPGAPMPVFGAGDTNDNYAINNDNLELA